MHSRFLKRPGRLPAKARSFSEKGTVVFRKRHGRFPKKARSFTGIGTVVFRKRHGQFRKKARSFSEKGTVVFRKTSGHFPENERSFSGKRAVISEYTQSFSESAQSFFNLYRAFQNGISVRGTVFELPEDLVEQRTEISQQRPHGAQSRAAEAVELEAGGEEVAGEAQEGGEAWADSVNAAPVADTRLALLETVREGVAPVGSRPERICARRTEPYGK